MRKFALGDLATIEDIRLEVDNKGWSWTSFMFQQPLFKRKELP